VIKAAVKLQTYDEVLNYTKNCIQTEGLGSLLSLAVKLKETDSQKTHLINKNALSKLLTSLSKDHIDLIVG
jgi:hypothetical protein